MPYKLFGGKKPQMNNETSMKTSAAMYASKTSMYGKKPMMNGGPGDDEKKKIAQQAIKHTGIAPGQPKAGGGDVMTKQMYNEDEQIKNLDLIPKVRQRAQSDYIKHKGMRRGSSSDIQETIRKSDPNLTDAQVLSLEKRLASYYTGAYNPTPKTAEQKRADEAASVLVASKLRQPKGGLTKGQAKSMGMAKVEQNYQARKKQEAASKSKPNMYGKKKK